MIWLDAFNPQMQAALIGALVAIVTTLFKDFLLSLWQERRKEKKEAELVFQKYADPLGLAATDLIWRLREVFSDEGRGLFLKSNAAPNAYNLYKQRSTLYRVASLLGWIRAFRREQSYLKSRKRKEFKCIQDALRVFESALADGPHVEVERLKKLAHVWELQLPNSEPELKGLAVELEQVMDRQFHQMGINDAALVSVETKGELCRELSSWLCGRLNSTLPSAEKVELHKKFCCDVLMSKEAWIYRDWQSGIGDLMIRNITASPRMFDAVGFETFEDMCISGDESQKRWLMRLQNMIDDVDISISSDCRVKQLKQMFLATATLIVALANVKSGNETISKKTLELAKDVCKDNTTSQTV